MEWPNVNLLDLCKPKQWPTISSKQLTHNGYPVFGANGQIGYYNSYNHEEPTILITCRGATCGTINISPSRCYVTGNAMALDDPMLDVLDLKFLYYSLISHGLRNTITGAAQPQITLSSLSRVFLPLPSPSEQRRIVEILDQANGLRKKRSEANAKASLILPALFYKMFGDPATNPKGRPIVSFGEMVDIGTRLVDPNQEIYLDLPHIGGEQIEGGTGRILDYKTVRESNLRSGKFIFSEKHVLYSKIRPYLNKVAFPRFSGVCSADIYPLLPKDKGISPWYIVALLQTQAFLSYATIFSERLRMPKLNQEQLSAFKSPLPDPDLVVDFERYASEIDRTLNLLKTQSEKVLQLFSLLLHRAFTGDLTAKWREAHMKELLGEMKVQAKVLG